MKLLTKNTIAYMLVTLLVFIVGGFIFYFHLKKIIGEETEEELEIKKSEVLSYIIKNRKVPEIPAFSAERVIIEKTDKLRPARTYDTLVYSRIESEELLSRCLTFYTIAGTEPYKITIVKFLFEDEDLLESILMSFLILACILVPTLLFLNLILSGIILKPFFNTLAIIKNYNVENQGVLHLEKTTTSEFTTLNESLNQMTVRISESYQNLKKFSENASHELQTPLAVIKNKTELLLQNAAGDQAKELNTIHQTASKAARLNQTLLLLSKIENRQFEWKDETNFTEILNSKIRFYEELFKVKEILLMHFVTDVKVRMNPELAEMVISNLIMNAVKYTPKGSTVEIELTPKKLKVNNKGEPLKSDPSKLFQRFYKENTDSDSTGLGLAIVYEIARANGHTLSYSYSDGMHRFEYRFS